VVLLQNGKGATKIGFFPAGAKLSGFLVLKREIIAFGPKKTAALLEDRRL
jgi:hypothetical protein